MLSNIIRTILIYAMSELPLQQIFDWGDHFYRLLYYKEVCVWQQLLGLDGQWVITVSYSVGIVGAVRLWEAADPKDQKLCLNCKCSIVCQPTPFKLPSSGITSVGMQYIQVLSLDIWTPKIFGLPMQTLKANPAIQTLETYPANHSYPEASPWHFWISAIVDNMHGGPYI